MNFEGKVVIVTGSTRGIGAAIATEFAKQGASVVVSGRNEQKLDEMQAHLSSFGIECLSVKSDVSLSEQAENLINLTIEKFGKVDILVNNAGITRDNLLMRMKENEWDEVIQVNLKGTYNCVKAVTRQMMKQRSGRIINITSVVGQMGNAGQTNYAASKAGIIGLTKSVAKELASRGITCNAIAPGFIETEMTEVLDDKTKDLLKTQIPLQRLGQVEDIAKAVLFLSSDDANYITGQTMNVDGGMVMA